MELKFVIDRTKASWIEEANLVMNPFPAKPKAELMDEQRKVEALKCLAEGVQNEIRLYRLIKFAGMSEEIAQLLCDHTVVGKRYDVIVRDTPKQELLLKEASDGG